MDLRFRVTNGEGSIVWASIRSYLVKKNLSPSVRHHQSSKEKGKPEEIHKDVEVLLEVRSPD